MAGVKGKSLFEICIAWLYLLPLQLVGNRINGTNIINSLFTAPRTYLCYIRTVAVNMDRQLPMLSVWVVAQVCVVVINLSQ